jgi:plastocyanin
MLTRLLKTATLAAILCLTLIVVGPGIADARLAHTTHTGATVKVVALKNGTYAFQPKTITVKVGTTVTWNNTTGTQHTVTTNNPKFGISLLNPHHKGKLTFKKVGTFKYMCSFHAYMHGIVKVLKK